MARKLCKDLKLTTFEKARKWIKIQNPSQNEPVYINKYGGQSQRPFRVWVFANVILAMSNENDTKQAQYIITKDKWIAFCTYVKEHPMMGTGELSGNHKEYKCTNITFWPAIISISKKVLE